MADDVYFVEKDLGFHSSCWFVWETFWTPLVWLVVSKPPLFCQDSPWQSSMVWNTKQRWPDILFFGKDFIRKQHWSFTNTMFQAVSGAFSLCYCLLGMFSGVLKVHMCSPCVTLLSQDGKSYCTISVNQHIPQRLGERWRVWTDALTIVLTCLTHLASG